MKEHFEKKQWKCIFIWNQWRNQAQYLLLITPFKCRIGSFIKIVLKVFQHTHNALCYRGTWWGSSPQWTVFIIVTERKKKKDGIFQLLFSYQVSLKSSISSNLYFHLHQHWLSYLIYECGNFIFVKFLVGFVFLILITVKLLY